MIKLAGSFEDRIEQPIELGKRYGKKPTNGFRGMQSPDFPRTERAAEVDLGQTRLTAKDVVGVVKRLVVRCPISQPGC